MNFPNFQLANEEHATLESQFESRRRKSSICSLLREMNALTMKANGRVGFFVLLALFFSANE